jgi:hypothetical protein
MEATVIFLLVLALVGVAYAQWHRGVVRTTAPLSLDGEEHNDLIALVTTKPQRPVS